MGLVPYPLRALRHRDRATGAGIGRAIGAMRRAQAGGDLAGNVGAGAKTGVEQAHPRQPVERGAICLEPR